MSMADELSEIIGQVRAHVQYQQQLGLEGFMQTSAPKTEPIIDKGHESEMMPEINCAEKAKALERIREEIGDCQRCIKLCKDRTHIVFGDGDPCAKLVFVGEGPGHDEDVQGLPFVGRAGQLLNKIIEAMGFKRSQVYICNIVKCRPPGNRNPERDEIEACEPFLIKQLEVIHPQIIVCLGTHATQTLLRTKEPISRLRGHFYDYQGIKLMPTFHPAYLLRNPPDKRLVWEDMQKVMAEFSKSAG